MINIVLLQKNFHNIASVLYTQLALSLGLVPLSVCEKEPLTSLVPRLGPSFCVQERTFDFLCVGKNLWLSVCEKEPCSSTSLYLQYCKLVTEKPCRLLQPHLVLFIWFGCSVQDAECEWWGQPGVSGGSSGQWRMEMLYSSSKTSIF